MANGDLLIQLFVPEKPAGSTLTQAEYIATVTAAVDAHLDEMGLTSSMPSWKNRTDIPADESGMPAFVEQRLSAAGFDVTPYDFDLANAGQSPQVTTYCIIDGQIQCYGSVLVAPSSPSTPNEFELAVKLGAALSVTVQLRFVVRPDFSFPT